MTQGQLRTISFEKAAKLMTKWQQSLVLSRDTEAEDLLAQRHIYRNVYFADCQGLVDDNGFIRLMRDMLKLFEAEYKRPVDVEFAVTASEENTWQLHLLQCRPLQTAQSEKVHIPTDADDEFLFDVRRTSMRRSKEEPVHYVVWIDPKEYYEYEYAKKPDVARLIGRINQKFEDSRQKASPPLARAHRHLLPRSWVFRWCMRRSASSAPSVRWPTARPDTTRSCPTEAICSRIW